MLFQHASPRIGILFTPPDQSVRNLRRQGEGRSHQGRPGDVVYNSSWVHNRAAKEEAKGQQAHNFKRKYAHPHYFPDDDGLAHPSGAPKAKSEGAGQQTAPHTHNNPLPRLDELFALDERGTLVPTTWPWGGGLTTEKKDCFTIEAKSSRETLGCFHHKLRLLQLIDRRQGKDDDDGRAKTMVGKQQAPQERVIIRKNSTHTIQKKKQKRRVVYTKEEVEGRGGLVPLQVQKEVLGELPVKIHSQGQAPILRWPPPLPRRRETIESEVRMAEAT